MAPTLRTRAQQQAQSRALRRTVRRSRNTNAVTKPKTKPRDAHQKLLEAIERSSPRAEPAGPPEPQNPRACLLGLPAELRLEIYRHVFDSSLIHVHKHKGQLYEDGRVDAPRFTWTPCRATNPKHPLLCANPKWSALCPESERCTFRPYASPQVNRVRGFAALATSCKFVRSETQDFFLRNTTVSIHPQDVQEWLDHLEKNTPSHIEQLRRITVAGPFDYRNNMPAALEQIEQRIPHLQGVGFQGQVNKWQMSARGVGMGVGHQCDVNGRWRSWRMAELMQRFGRDVTVVMEGYTWAKARRFGPTEDLHSVFQVARKGRDTNTPPTPPSPVSRLVQGVVFGVLPPSPGWDDRDVEIESYTSKPLAYKRNAKWRQWWRGNETKHFM